MQKYIYLYDIAHYNPDSAQLEYIRVASDKYISRPTDTPANTVYHKKIKTGGAGSFETFMFARGSTFGASAVGDGTLILSNIDREYDGLRTHDFRSVTIRRATSHLQPLADTEVIATLEVESAELTFSELRITMLDRLGALDVQLQTATFTGDNADAFDIDGNPALEGVLRPVLIGSTGWFKPLLANSQSLLYLINHDKEGNPAAIASVDGVKDNGVDITFHADYATINALVTAQQAASIPSGKYGTCLAQGAIALNNIVGTITVKASEGATLADRTAAQCTQRIITRFSDFTTSDFEGISALDTLNNAVVGAYIDGADTIVSVAQFLIGSIGGFIVPRINGKFKVGTLTDPSLSPASAKKLLESDLIKTGVNGLQRVNFSDDSGGVPTHKVVVNYARYYETLAENDVAGSVAIDERTDLGREYRAVTAEDASILTTYRLSEPITFDTALLEKAAAQARADDELALRKIWRDQWIIKVPLEDALYDISDIVTLDVDAFDMSGGKNFTVLGLKLDLNGNESVEYYIYG